MFYRIEEQQYPHVVSQYRLSIFLRAGVSSTRADNLDCFDFYPGSLLFWPKKLKIKTIENTIIGRAGPVLSADL